MSLNDVHTAIFPCAFCIEHNDKCSYPAFRLTWCYFVSCTDV